MMIHTDIQTPGLSTRRLPFLNSEMIWLGMVYRDASIVVCSRMALWSNGKTIHGIGNWAEIVFNA